MGEATGIEWARNSDGSPGYTFNPWRGCTKISEACRFCYAERDRSVRLHRVGWGPTAERRIAADSTWAQPLAWDMKHRRARTRGRVFCASLADIFEDRPELEAPRIRLLALIALTPSLDWLLLTKRPEVMARVMNDPGLYERVLAAANVWRRAYPRRDLSAIPVSNPSSGWHNLWAGTTVENQRAADERIPHLLRVPARVRFLSCEPVLGYINMSGGLFTQPPEGEPDESPEAGGMWGGPRTLGAAGLSWVIAGGESGPGARPSHPDWFRGLRDQCAAAGVPFFFKQWGDWRPKTIQVSFACPASGHSGYPLPYQSLAEKEVSPGVYMERPGKKAAGRLLDGRTHDGMPEVPHA